MTGPGAPRLPAPFPWRFPRRRRSPAPPSIRHLDRPHPLADRRVLVTGGSGFIGSHLIHRLCQVGALVMSVDLLRPRRRFPVPFQAVECDIRSAKLPPVVAQFAPHVVVHLAAQVSVTDSVRNPARDADVNVRGMITVAEAATAAGAELLVFAASCAIYGTAAELPVSEDAAVQPITPYGLSKAAAVCYGEWFAQFRGLPVTSLILGNVYGPGQRGGVIRQFLADAATSRPSVLNGKGSPTRDFVHVHDVVDAVLRGCARPGAGRVNIGSGIETSVARVLEIVSAATGQAIPPTLAAARDGDIERMCLRIDRAASRLNWKPQTGLAEGIAALVPVSVRVGE